MIFGIDASQANRENRSGTEWYAFYLIKNLAKLLGNRSDIRVVLYFRDQPQADLKEKLPENFECKVLGWPIKHFWSQGRLSLEMLFHAPDILLVPAHTIPIISPKFTFTALHDIGFRDNPELYDRLSLWYHRFSARLATWKASHIFTISEYTKQRIVKQYKYDSNKISVTPLAYDRDKYFPRNQSQVEKILTKYNLSYQSYIFYVGRLEPKKNILGMVRAYDIAQQKTSNLPDMVFAGPKVNIDEVDKYLSTREGLQKKIKFLGYVNEEDKPALYAGAKIFFFPTFYEGFGMPIIEAQASGVPVITSNTTANPEVAGNIDCLVDPKNIQQISNKLIELAESAEKRVELIEKGLQNTKSFSWERVAEQTWSTIESTIK